MKRWGWFFLMVLGFLLIIAMGFLLKIDLDKKEDISSMKDNGLPIIDISLNGTTLEEFKASDRLTKFAGNRVRVIDYGIKEYDDVEIKGRGNSTWSEEKKPIQIKFNNKVGLLGLNKSKTFILLANYFDDSFLRNSIASRLSEMIDSRYILNGKFFELYIDGEYEGLYYLMNKVEIAQNLVNLKDEKGVLVELDTLRNFDGVCFTTYKGDCLKLTDAVSKKNEVVKLRAMESFLADFDALEFAVREGDYIKVSQLIDIDSFAKFYLVKEFAADPDAYQASWFMYKDGDEDKIHAGPLWDFDLAFGNYQWGDNDKKIYYSPRETMVRRRDAFDENGNEKNIKASKLIYFLMDIPEFKERVSQIFQEYLSGRKDELVTYISKEAEKIRKAAELDGDKWAKSAFDSEVEYVSNWVEERFDYFEEVYGQNLQVRNSFLQ